MRIFIAEDDPISRTLLETAIAAWGHDLQLASDGNAAWEILQQDDAPRLAILDWVMPGINGIDLCRKIREKERKEQVLGRAPLYIIILTARNSRKDTVQGHEAGANDYITKPCRGDELRTHIDVGCQVVELQESLARQTNLLRESIDLVKRAAQLEAACQITRQNNDDPEIWNDIKEFLQSSTT